MSTTDVREQQLLSEFGIRLDYCGEEIAKMAFHELAHCQVPFPMYLNDERQEVLNSDGVRIQVENHPSKGFRFYVSIGGIQYKSPYFHFEDKEGALKDRVIFDDTPKEAVVATLRLLKRLGISATSFMTDIYHMRNDQTISLIENPYMKITVTRDHLGKYSFKVEHMTDICSSSQTSGYFLLVS